MKERFHLIGIGGIGMSAIAQLLLRKGNAVSGSDLKDSSYIQELKRQGAEIFIGHRKEHVQGVGRVIYSSAIREDNPEIIEARKLNIPVIKRAQALAELMRDKKVITVTGSHGKTTTSSLAAFLLIEAGLYPSVAVGGIVRNLNTNARFGEGDFFVAEADESDGSFLFYQPDYSIITNIDREHLDYYKNFENELQCFREFVAKTNAGGCIFACADDLNLRKMAKIPQAKTILFGLKEGADIVAANITLGAFTSEFDCLYNNKPVARFKLALTGLHNISNSLAVIALGLELGIDIDCIKRTLANYEGAKRRLEIKLNQAGHLVIDDYAHHPTEIKATLAAAKNLKKKRIIAVFQPHRFSRTQALLDEFGESFDDADYLILTDIYAASEQPIKGVDAQGIAEKVKIRSPHKEVQVIAKEKIVQRVLELESPDDLIITLGAGDITKISDELSQRLAGQRPAGRD